MRIESILVGKPKPVTFRGREHETAIFKELVPGPVMLRKLNLDGDAQADLRVHGGPDKALYAYGIDAYEIWKPLRPSDSFPHGAMGENLAMTTLLEDKIYIGDTFRLGDAVVQAAQPRFPCYKLGIKFKDPTILKQFMRVGRPGVYFRVIKEGMVAVGQSLQLIDSEKTRVSILELFQLQTAQTIDKARLREMLQVKGLPAQWRAEIHDLVNQS